MLARVMWSKGYGVTGAERVLQIPDFCFEPSRQGRSLAPPVSSMGQVTRSVVDVVFTEMVNVSVSHHHGFNILGVDPRFF
jgi:hypothetical protein